MVNKGIMKLCCLINGGKCVICNEIRGCKDCDPWMFYYINGEIYCGDNGKCCDAILLRSGAIGSIWGVNIIES